MKLKAIRKHKLFCYLSRPKTYFEPYPHSYESPISSFIQCQLISTPTQLNLNSISTKLPLNLIATSFQPQVQINLSLNSTSTITSTQYGCDIKATQSCIYCVLPNPGKIFHILVYTTVHIWLLSFLRTHNNTVHHLHVSHVVLSDCSHISWEPAPTTLLNYLVTLVCSTSKAISWERTPLWCLPYLGNC